MAHRSFGAELDDLYIESIKGEESLTWTMRPERWWSVDHSKTGRVDPRQPRPRPPSPAAFVQTKAPACVVRHKGWPAGSRELASVQGRLRDGDACSRLHRFDRGSVKVLHRKVEVICFGTPFARAMSALCGRRP